MTRNICETQLHCVLHVCLVKISCCIVIVINNNSTGYCLLIMMVTEWMRDLYPLTQRELNSCHCKTSKLSLRDPGQCAVSVIS